MMSVKSWGSNSDWLLAAKPNENASTLKQLSTTCVDGEFRLEAAPGIASVSCSTPLITTLEPTGAVIGRTAQFPSPLISIYLVREWVEVFTLTMAVSAMLPSLHTAFSPPDIIIAAVTRLPRDCACAAPDDSAKANTNKQVLLQVFFTDVT